MLKILDVNFFDFPSRSKRDFAICFTTAAADVESTIRMQMQNKRRIRRTALHP